MKIFIKVIFIRPETNRSNYEQVEGITTGGLNPWMLQNSGMICN